MVMVVLGLFAASAEVGEDVFASVGADLTDSDFALVG